MELLKSIFLRKKRSKEVPEALHMAIMEQSLQPCFFGDGKLEDSFAGRFEVVALHSALVFRRLRDMGEAGNGLAQETFNELFSGFDDALREIGTGDLKVGKKVRVIGESFYGRAKAYDEAISERNDLAMKDAILRNMNVNDGFADVLAKYASQAAVLFDNQQEERMLTAEIDWPSVEEVNLWAN
ncbi:ubiquinol-cytochrome C chaperone family protein [Hirschia litorea]|uniref:Ubiquinol-cytochrome C chaperone family protein n=1 Tax=Hirschia litorea TaxID=1199156 RepID=A0ABW2IHE8_9PROT